MGVSGQVPILSPRKGLCANGTMAHRPDVIRADVIRDFMCSNLTYKYFINETLSLILANLKKEQSRKKPKIVEVCNGGYISVSSG